MQLALASDGAFSVVIGHHQHRQFAVPPCPLLPNSRAIFVPLPFLFYSFMHGPTPAADWPYQRLKQRRMANDPCVYVCWHFLCGAIHSILFVGCPSLLSFFLSSILFLLALLPPSSVPSIYVRSSLKLPSAAPPNSPPSPCHFLESTGCFSQPTSSRTTLQTYQLYLTGLSPRPPPTAPFFWLPLRSFLPAVNTPTPRHWTGD